MNFHTTLTNVQYGGFKAYSDALITDKQGNIVFASLLGNKASLKAITAGMLGLRHEVHITKPECRNSEAMALKSDYEFSSVIVHVDPVTSLDHVIIYPDNASFQKIDRDMKDIIYLYREDNPEFFRSLYLYLDKVLDMPIHESWTPELIKSMREEGMISDLPGVGKISGMKIDLWTGKIQEIITQKIRNGEFRGMN